MRFFGKSQHTVDDKGRVSLPAKLRKALPDEVVIVPAFGDALYVFDEKAFVNWVDMFFNKEDGYNQRDEMDRKLHARLFSTAQSVNVDAAGRVKLSPTHRQKAGIGKDVIITGCDDHVEIWDPAKYEAFMGEDTPLEDLLGN